MGYKEYSKRLLTVSYLVEKGATGTPKELANKLEISEKTARRMINHLRQQGESIKYCRIRQSYIFT